MTADRIALVACAALLACTGDVGTIRIQLTWAPGTSPLESATVGRLRLSNPPIEAAVDLSGDAPSLALDIEARRSLATVTFEAENASGELVAFGKTPPLPISAIDFELVIYVAPPWSVGEAPVSLTSARHGLGSAELTYGGALFGGIDDSGAVSSEMLIYNAFQHELQEGEPLPEGRARAAAIADSRGIIYIFGGIDGNGDERSAGYRFNTNIAPAGAYSELEADGGLARSGTELLPVGIDRYLLTGAPLGLIDGVEGTATALDGGADIGGPGASLIVGDDLVPTAVILGADSGATGAALVRGDLVTAIGAPAQALRSGHRVVAAGHRVLAIGGLDPSLVPVLSALVYDPAGDSYEVVDDFLSETRVDPGVAVTSRFVVVAGGRNELAEPSSSVDVFDRETLERVATLPMSVPRVAPSLLALDNGQVLIAGGISDGDVGTDAIEILTPGDD